MALILLALRPIDTLLIRVTCLLFTAIFFFCFLLMMYIFISTYAGTTRGRRAFSALAHLALSLVALANVAILWPTLPGLRWCVHVRPCVCLHTGNANEQATSPRRLCRRPITQPRQQLLRLWLMARLSSVVAGAAVLSILLDGVAAGVMPRPFGPEALPHETAHFLTGCSFLLASLVFTPASRGRILRGLGGLSKRGSQQQEAAIIASCFGRCSATEVLAIARRRFRVMPLRAFLFFHGPQLFARRDDNEDGNEELRRQTTAAALGDCSAFISHSSLDDRDAKWRTLCEWGATAPEGATLWVDNVCMDLDDVATSLLCLPVFLSGCQVHAIFTPLPLNPTHPQPHPHPHAFSQELVLLLGPSFTSRLWCAVEVFAFLQMGAQHHRIRPFAFGESTSDFGNETRAHHEAARRREIAAFDAHKAQCEGHSDRELLLAVIEAGLGGLEPFNVMVRQVLGGGAPATRVAADSAVQAVQYMYSRSS